PSKKKFRESCILVIDERWHAFQLSAWRLKHPTPIAVSGAFTRCGRRLLREQCAPVPEQRAQPRTRTRRRQSTARSRNLQTRFSAVLPAGIRGDCENACPLPNSRWSWLLQTRESHADGHEPEPLGPVVERAAVRFPLVEHRHWRPRQRGLFAGIRIEQPLQK